MKKYILLALVVLTGMASSCKYDDNELWDNVNNLADRVTALENLTKQMNSDIAAVKSIVTALENKITVLKVETLADGYIIHFTDGTNATIKNGADGKDGVNGEDGKDGTDGKDAPIINVAEFEGVYYWTLTLDGETTWLTDEVGNKMAVTGTSGSNGSDGANGSNGSNGSDGANGNTPKLKVDSEGYWQVSYDNGATYAFVEDASGNKVKATGEKGQDADSMFDTLTKGDGVVVVKMADAIEYILPLVSSVEYTGITDNKVTVAALDKASFTYKVTAWNTADAEVVKVEGDIKATVKGNEITVESTKDEAGLGKVVLLFYNDYQTLTSVLDVEITK